MFVLERRPLAWMEEAPQRVSATRDLGADADAIFAVLARHEEWPTWFTGVRRVTVTGAPEGVGGRRRVVVKGLGAFDEEYLAWDPGQRFGFAVTHTSRPLFRVLNELVTIERAPGGARVTYEQAFAARALTAPLFRLAARRRTPAVLGAALEALGERAQRQS